MKRKFYIREEEAFKLKKRRRRSRKKKEERLERCKNKRRKANHTFNQKEVSRLIKCRELDVKSKKYWSWRRRVFKRDNYTCQECGREGKDLRLEVLHIIPWHKSQEGRFRLSNGKTLCSDCFIIQHPWSARDAKTKKRVPPAGKDVCAVEQKVILRKRIDRNHHAEEDVSKDEDNSNQPIP